MRGKGTSSAAYFQHRRLRAGEDQSSFHTGLQVSLKIFLPERLDQAFISYPRQYGPRFCSRAFLEQKRYRIALFYSAARSIVIFFAFSGFDHISRIYVCERCPFYFPSTAAIHFQRRHARMVWPVRAEHAGAVMLSVISCVRASSIIQIHEHFPVFGSHPESLPALLQIKIRISAVHRSDSRHIFRFLHPSFNLKRINPRIDKIRDQFQRAHIFQTHIILLSPAYRPRKPAGLSALSPVSAAPSDHTAQQALSGITVA